MYTSTPRGLKTIYVFLFLQIFRTVQCKTAEYASIPYLLARSEYCQVQIIYDKIGDDVLQPVCSSNFHPLTLIQVKNIMPRTPFTLLKIRSSKCKISFVIYKYYFPGNVTLRQPWNSLWMSIATNYFKQSKSDYFSHQNVYTILVSAIQKSKLNKIFEYPRISSLATDPLLDNFGILLLARNRTFNLCVQRVGTWSEKISTMECKQSENGNIVTLFENLLSSPILWKLDSLSDIGIEGGQHVDFSKLTFHSNPFNRKFLFISIFCKQCSVKPTQVCIIIFTHCIIEMAHG